MLRNRTLRLVYRRLRTVVKKMRIAYLIQCQNAEQVNLLVAALDDAQSDFYIHVDKKSDIQREIAQAKNAI